MKIIILLLLLSPTAILAQDSEAYIDYFTELQRTLNSKDLNLDASFDVDDKNRREEILNKLANFEDEVGVNPTVDGIKAKVQDCLNNFSNKVSISYIKASAESLSDCVAFAEKAKTHIMAPTKPKNLANKEISLDHFEMGPGHKKIELKIADIPQNMNLLEGQENLKNLIDNVSDLLVFDITRSYTERERTQLVKEGGSDLASFLALKEMINLGENIACGQDLFIEKLADSNRPKAFHDLGLDQKSFYKINNKTFDQYYQKNADKTHVKNLEKIFQGATFSDDKYDVYLLEEGETFHMVLIPKDGGKPVVHQFKIDLENDFGNKIGSDDLNLENAKLDQVLGDVNKLSSFKGSTNEPSKVFNIEKGSLSDLGVPRAGILDSKIIPMAMSGGFKGLGYNASKDGGSLSFTDRKGDNNFATKLGISKTITESNLQLSGRTNTMSGESDKSRLTGSMNVSANRLSFAGTVTTNDDRKMLLYYNRDQGDILLTDNEIEGVVKEKNGGQIGLAYKGKKTSSLVYADTKEELYQMEAGSEKISMKVAFDNNEGNTDIMQTAIKTAFPDIALALHGSAIVSSDGNNAKFVSGVKTKDLTASGFYEKNKNEFSESETTGGNINLLTPSLHGIHRTQVEVTYTGDSDGEKTKIIPSYSYKGETGMTIAVQGDLEFRNSNGRENHQVYGGMKFNAQTPIGSDQSLTMSLIGENREFIGTQVGGELDYKIKSRKTLAHVSVGGNYVTTPEVIIEGDTPVNLNLKAAVGVRSGSHDLSVELMKASNLPQVNMTYIFHLN